MNGTHDTSGAILNTSQKCIRWRSHLVGGEALHQRGCEAAQEKKGRLWVVTAQLLMGSEETMPHFAGQSQGAT